MVCKPEPRVTVNCNRHLHLKVFERIKKKLYIKLFMAMLLINIESWK